MKAQKTTDTSSGIYILELFAGSTFTISIKKYSKLVFPKGYYYYSGSAQKNFNSRILRHLSKDKNVYWHIDYLTTHPKLKIMKCFIFPGKSKSFECKTVTDFEIKFNLIHPAKDFGNSDCNNCISHLLYSRKRISSKKIKMIYPFADIFKN